MKDGIISFVRQKDYILERYIGEGGLGKTALLKDPMIDEYFVCKKYEPMYKEHQAQYYENFKNEIKIMHQLYHKNIVRIFNYYLYPQYTTGYILMDYIQGSDMARHLEQSPENINSVFTQTIDAFSYLEENNILHRDIRPANILVTNGGTVKVIDFGFGKAILNPDDFNKSISLNWWCEVPSDFQENIYDFSTEVYFVGKLFEEIIAVNSITEFKHEDLINQMIVKSHNKRNMTFSDAKEKMLNEAYDFDDYFDYDEKITYRAFIGQLIPAYAEISRDATCNTNIESIIKKLEELLKNNALEEVIQYTPDLLRIFVVGKYTYYAKKDIRLSALKDFLRLLRSSSNEKRNIILLNISNRVRTIKRMKNEIDDVPF